MGRSPSRDVLALALTGALAAGCQNYSYNPVSRCVIQPGSERVTVSNISSADVLFVVDDSGSMQGEQVKLAAAFDAFIDSLAAYNDRRVTNRLEPFDFHIAITTTSVFMNRPVSGIQDHYVFPRQLRECSGNPDCTSPYVCGSCAGLSGVCCSALTGGYPQLDLACTPGIAADGAPYPHGDFVGLGTNPRVLHFDKSLFGDSSSGTWLPVNPATAENAQGFTRDELKGYFKTNVFVGTCGSGQEQGLQAGRLAISKALQGDQRDTRDRYGNVVPAGVAADWPHAGAKLVVVYVGDEDDCSSPEDPDRAIVLTGSAGDDSCVADAALPLDQQKEFRVDDIVRDLQALGRPVGAAFVVSAANTACLDDSCTAGMCSDSACTAEEIAAGVCGGQAPGSRLLAAADALRRAHADVIAASICDPGATPCSSNVECASLAGSTCVPGCGGNAGSFCCKDGALALATPAAGFAPILSRVAEIVKPPSALMLPTQPADGAVALLRITRTDGTTRTICNGPADPALDYEQARAQGYDWWFTQGREQLTAGDKKPSVASRYIYINHDSSRCAANPGETYSADYLGVVPSGGCRSHADCATALGDLGEGSEWSCFAGFASDGTCVDPATKVGTCVCGTRAATCPNG